MRVPFILALALVAACRSREPATVVRAEPHEPPAPPPVVPVAPTFHPIAPGIALAELERPYDTTLAEIDIVRLSLAAVDLDVRRLPERRFSPLFDDTAIDVAINGGYFERDFSPSGLVVVDGDERSPASPRGGSGVVRVRDGRAELVSLDAIGTDRDDAFAIQCGPRLIETDGSVGIARDDGRRAARTVLCLRDGGRTLDLVVVRRRIGLGGPSLFEVATWLHAGLVPGEGGCESALNLDGGPSTGLYVRGAPSARRIPNGPVVDAIVVRSLRPTP